MLRKPIYRLFRFSNIWQYQFDFGKFLFYQVTCMLRGLFRNFTISIFTKIFQLLKTGDALNLPLQYTWLSELLLFDIFSWSLGNIQTDSLELICMHHLSLQALSNRLLSSLQSKTKGIYFLKGTFIKES